MKRLHSILINMLDIWGPLGVESYFFFLSSGSLEENHHLKNPNKPSPTAPATRTLVGVSIPGCSSTCLIVMILLFAISNGGTKLGGILLVTIVVRLDKVARF